MNTNLIECDCVACMVAAHLPKRKIHKLTQIADEIGYKVYFGFFGDYGITVGTSDTEGISFPSVGTAEKWLRRERRRNRK